MDEDWYNDVDLVDIGRALDRGDALSLLVRDYGTKTVSGLLARVAGGPDGIDIAEAKRRVAAGERLTSVALRARAPSISALRESIRRHDATDSKKTRALAFLKRSLGSIWGLRSSLT